MPLLQRNDFSMYKGGKCGQSKKKHIYPHTKKTTAPTIKKNGKPTKENQIQQRGDIIQESEENLKSTKKDVHIQLDERETNQDYKVQMETVVEQLQKKVSLKQFSILLLSYLRLKEIVEFVRFLNFDISFIFKII